MIGLTIKKTISRLAIVAGVVTVAYVPAACDDDATGPTLGVAGPTTLQANATVANALAGTAFSFPGGAGVLASSVAGQNLTVTFGGTATATTATLLVGTTTVTANVTYGSCIFTVTNSSFPPGHALANGQIVTVNNCSVSVNTTGVVANGVAVNRSVALVLGAANSTGAPVSVGVSSNGNLTLNGNIVAVVTLVPLTGTTS